MVVSNEKKYMHTKVYNKQKTKAEINNMQYGYYHNIGLSIAMETLKSLRLC